VVGFVKKGEVEELCKAETRSNPGTTDYLAGYQGALRKVVEQLGEEEATEYLALAKEWNELSAPVDVQRRSVVSGTSSEMVGPPDMFIGMRNYMGPST